MSNQICLKWNSFLNNIATSFESLWEEEGLVDVTLASDGQCLTAHKVILSASSPFFKKVFQTNPCQHPVIILQDVHFRELEALLIFIYKGEVNIEQQNLPALLKAAETLKIRGLSGGDMFAKESYKRFVDLDNSESSDILPAKDEAPKKRQKVAKKQNNSILEKALNPQSTVNENSNDANSAIVEQNFKEPDPAPDPVLLRLEMKTEPLEIHAEDFQKHSPVRKDPLERLDTGQNDSIQGSGNSPAEEISGLSGLSGVSGISDQKPVAIYAYQQLPYADLLPNPEVIATWATSRPMDHLACDLMKILFTPEERILCNVNGKMGKQQFDSNKIHLIREVLIHFSGISSDSIEWEEAWKNCVTKIDTSNRGLKSLKTVLGQEMLEENSIALIPVPMLLTMDIGQEKKGRRFLMAGSSKPTVTVIPEARETSSTPPGETRPLTKYSTEISPAHTNPSNYLNLPNSSNSPVDNSSSVDSPMDIPEPLTFPSDHNPSISQPAFPPYNNPNNLSDSSEESHNLKGGTTNYPPFPCPFCDRAYTSWGFRRRHIKAVHTISPMLNCKWCLQVLPTHAAWRRHVISAHNLSASDAHNGLLILEEAHMVLQIAHPTRLDTLVNIIKQSSQQSSGADNNAQADKDND